MREWIEESCPKCKARQLFDNGDPEDFTVMDISSVECYKCHHKWFVGIEGMDEFDEDHCRLGVKI